jgi:prevent-host-death family protein
MEVGVRELKARLSEHLARVRAGETVVVTDRGKPIAKLVPVERPDVPPHLAVLVTSGRARWSGQHLPPFDPLPVVPGDGTIADMVAEDRR